MPATHKVSTQLLVSPDVRDTARALAIVRRESVAEIFRMLAEPALDDEATTDVSAADVHRDYVVPALDEIERLATSRPGLAEVAKIRKVIGERVSKLLEFVEPLMTTPTGRAAVQEIRQSAGQGVSADLDEIERLLSARPSVADIYRTAIEPRMDDLAAKHGPKLNTLYEAFDSMGVLDRGRALEYMLEHKIRYTDLFGSDGAPLTEFPGKL